MSSKSGAKKRHLLSPVDKERRPERETAGGEGAEAGAERRRDVR